MVLVKLSERKQTVLSATMLVRQPQLGKIYDFRFVIANCEVRSRKQTILDWADANKKSRRARRDEMSVAFVIKKSRRDDMSVAEREQYLSDMPVIIVRQPKSKIVN